MTAQTKPPSEETEMLTTKIRTALAVLAAASTMAVATGPIAAVASARPNIPGRFDRSAEGLHLKGSIYPDTYCGRLHSSFDSYGTMVLNDLLSKQYDYAATDSAAQQQVLDNAKKAGCGWAT
jgi:hypothetical protein